MAHLHDLKWRFERLGSRAKENGKEFFGDLTHDIKEVLVIPLDFAKDLKRFIVTIWKFRSLLWWENDFDYNDILNFMEFKIKRLRDHVEKHHHHLHWKKDVKNMDKALELINRAKDDMYHWDACMKPLEEKYGKHIRYTECDVLNSKEVLNRPYRSSISKYEKETNKNSDQIHKEARASMNKSHRLHQKDWNDLWKHLNKNMRSWWC